MTTPQTRRAAQWWDSARGVGSERLRWHDIPRVQARVNRAITGHEDRDWIGHTLTRHVRTPLPVARCLSLGCGEGEWERALARHGSFQECLALDVSEGQLERARTAAAAAGIAGIEYRLADLEHVELPEADLIVAAMSLHHVTNLEGLAERIAGALRPDACFAAIEYVGADRLDFSPCEVEAFTRALLLLPERYRESVSWERSGALGGERPHRTLADWLRVVQGKLRGGSLGAAIRRNRRSRQLRREGGSFVKTEIPTTRGAELAAVDPSEAVRASAILPVFRERLEIVEVRPFGSALLMMVLDDIEARFADGSEESTALLQMLFSIDDALVQSGELHNDFVYFAARGRR